MNEIFVIGDVHGCYKTLRALVKKLPKNAKLCFAGDLIDRGKDSFKVVQFVLENGHFAVRGNHEELLIRSGFLEGVKYSQISPNWLKCGGEATIKSYKKANLKLKELHFEFYSNLPHFLEFDLRHRGRQLVVSHAAVGEYWQHRSGEDELCAEAMEHFVWARRDFFENKSIFNVYGHTPQNEPFLTKGVANVDLGCVYKNKMKNARLCAISFPGLKIFTQENIE